MIPTVKNLNFIFESSKFFATLLAIMCARRLAMNCFYRMEERLIRWDKKLKAWGKRRKRKMPKQKKRALRKRCAQIEKQSKYIVSQETFQEYYEEIFKNTLGVARKSVGNISEFGGVAERVKDCIFTR